ncbi:SufS family cysteine desulfurase [Pendulispora brunnea]|uniref:cysteine desulfurase n=1 Tax=Pendulispora brunnea TaxID=2905690 RepID=A0ABZ2K1W1_9BACT
MSTSKSPYEPEVALDAGTDDLVGAMAKELERLANNYFAQGPMGASSPVMDEAVPEAAPAISAAAPLSVSAPLVPPRVGPHALNVGGGGISPASAPLPPVPGAVHRPPLAASPPPTDRDLRALPTILSEYGHTPSPIEVARATTTNDAYGGANPAPYYLQTAGIPGSPPASPATAPTPTLPGGGVSGSSFQVPVNVGDFAIVPDALPRDSGLGMDVTNAPTGSAAPYFLSLAGLPTSVSSNGAPPVPDFGGLPFQVPTDVPPAPALPYSANSGVLAGDPMAAEVAAPPATAVEPVPSWTAHEFSPQLVPDLGGTTATAPGVFDANAVRRDFPILEERVHGRRLVWLDNAATTQKPQAVIDRISYYYEHENSNIHRAAHALAARATDAYEAARDKVRRFLNAPSPKNIVFVRGATEGINLVAQSWGRRNVSAGDEIVITWLEHHANIVPWQQLCSEKGCRLRVAPVNDRGEVILDEYEKLLGPKTRLVSFTQVSNALGSITPAREMVEIAHRYGATVHVDGAQAVSHMPVDVQLLGADFYSFSGHKVFGPTGIGVLYGTTEILEAMPPWQGGGNMIADVTFEKTTYGPPPSRFEAGTGNIADAVGLGAALDYVSGLGLANVQRYEHELLTYAEEKLSRVPGLRIIGTAREKAGVISFILDGQRTEEVGGMLDQEGIAVRSGHHCAQPILRRFGLEATVRASLAPYNTTEDIDALAEALHRIQAGRPVRGL